MPTARRWLTGTAGELAIRAPTSWKGYWNKPGETAAVLENGWYYSGDGATMERKASSISSIVQGHDHLGRRELYFGRGRERESR